MDKYDRLKLETESLRAQSKIVLKQDGKSLDELLERSRQQKRLLHEYDQLLLKWQLYLLEVTSTDNPQ